MCVRFLIRGLRLRNIVIEAIAPIVPIRAPNIPSNAR
jgi:hypothetical protein